LKPLLLKAVRKNKKGFRIFRCFRGGRKGGKM
jgi:hypothetical protein